MDEQVMFPIGLEETTEDEEVKFNCHGRKHHYESSDSQTEDDSDMDDSFYGVPVKFISVSKAVSTLGDHVCKPIPISKSSPIIFNKEDSFCSYERSQESSCYSASSESSESSSSERKNCLKSDGNSSEKGNCSVLTSFSNEEEESYDSNSTLFHENDIEVESSVYLSTEELCANDYEDVSSESASYCKEVDEQGNLKGNCKTMIGLELVYSNDDRNDPQDNRNKATMTSPLSAGDSAARFIASKVSEDRSDCECSITREELDTIIQEGTTDFNFSDTDDNGIFTSNTMDFSCQPTAEIESEAERGSVEIKPKRVLSCHTLCNAPQEYERREIQKRCRLSTSEEDETKTYFNLSFLNLGDPAYLPPSVHEFQKSPSNKTEVEEQCEYDYQLGEELNEKLEEISRKSITSNPIPLLTPPTSPVFIEGFGGNAAVCEWPSNLVVDNALTSAMELRALSPRSLQKQVEEDCRFTSPTFETKLSNKVNATFDPSTGLTPKLEGITMKSQ